MSENTATVVMLVMTGESEQSRWFRFKPGFFLPEFTIEWLPDSMIADGLPVDLAGVLITKGYARALTEEELTAPAPAPVAAAEPEAKAKASTETGSPSRQSRKGERHDQNQLQ